ncbi:MAG: transcription termination/antitermination factor NusG [Lachnospiraceae bacterium]|nr:transcription termination/antitermination factor NusG [Lachnospiraceae bacterium]
MADAQWYVVHTYSGYENKVKANIEKTIENRKLQDQILEVSIPMQDVVEVKNGVSQLVQKKMFPAYVLVHMIMNEDTWYVVRNTRGVTGFVGPGSKPVPLTEAELINMGLIAGKAESLYNVGDQVVVTTGVWKDTVGVVKAVNEGKQSVTISIDMFGRETPVELGFAEIKKF